MLRRSVIHRRLAARDEARQGTAVAQNNVRFCYMSTQGTQIYVREGDMGDPKRLFIGGVQSLYRVQAYTGAWEDDKKEGTGNTALLLLI